MKFKHFLSIILVFVLSFGMCSFALADEIAEVADGYTPIYTAEDLNNVRNNLSGKYVFMNHIDLSSYTEWNQIGSFETPFTGELDGNGYSILGFKSNCSLLGRIDNSVVKNLGIVDCTIIETEETASNSTVLGAFAEYSTNSSFEKCFVTGSINPCVRVGMMTVMSSCSVGGLVGVSRGSTFVNCYNNAGIHFNYDKVNISKIGGLVGESYNSNFECCYNAGAISLENVGEVRSSNTHEGGLAGFADESTVFDCCYYLDNISCAIGNSQTNSNGTQNLTNAEMKNQNSYIGFNFDEIWEIIPDNYPKLIIEKPFKTQKVSINYKEKIDVNKYVVGDVSGFASSDESVVAIDDAGYIHGLSVGEASVTIFTKDNHIVVLNIDVSYNIWQKLIVYFLFGWLWY